MNLIAIASKKLKGIFVKEALHPVASHIVGARERGGINEDFLDALISLATTEELSVYLEEDIRSLRELELILNACGHIDRSNADAPALSERGAELLYGYLEETCEDSVAWTKFLKKASPFLKSLVLDEEGQTVKGYARQRLLSETDAEDLSQQVLTLEAAYS